MASLSTYTNRVPLPTNRHLSHAASLLIENADLTYWDSTALSVKPASSFPDHGDAATTQRAFAAAYTGMDQQTQSASDSTGRPALLHVDVEIEMPCASSTFAVGDYVAPTYTAGVLSDQEVTRVTDPTRAIGRVLKRYSSATTTVWVRLTSSLLAGLLNDASGRANVSAPAGQQPGDAGSSGSATGGRGGPHTTGTAGAGGAWSVTGGDGGAATGAAGIGGAGAAWTGSGGAGGASTSSSGGNAGAGGSAATRGGAGGAASGTGAAAGGAGGAWTGGGAAGGSAAGTSAAGAGGDTLLTSGAGGSKTGTGAAAGGAAGALAITGGAGGSTASAGANAGGAGASITITAGAGGNATAGTGDGGAGGTLTLAPGAGGTTTGGTAGVTGIVRVGGTNPVPLAANLARNTIANAGTVTVAQVRGGILYQDASGGNVTMTSPTASNLDTAFPALATGNALTLAVCSNHATNTSTISGGTGVTLVGSGAVTQTGGTFLLHRTGSAAYDLIRVG